MYVKQTKLINMHEALSRNAGQGHQGHMSQCQGRPGLVCITYTYIRGLGLGSLGVWGLGIKGIGWDPGGVGSRGMTV